MRNRLFILGLAVVSDMALAQGPLTIEQLLIDASRWQLVSGYEFRSASSGSGATAESTGWSTALRYGVSSRLELSTRFAAQQRQLQTGTLSSQQSVKSLSVGSNWLLRQESNFPALMVELNGDFRADVDGGALEYSATRWALTGYRTLDPLVLSFTVGGHREQSRREDGLRLQPGSGYLVNGRVNFAVNPRVTLFGGVSFQSYAATRLNGQKRPRPAGSVAINGGLAFATSSRHTFFLDADVAPQVGASGMSLRWFMDF